MRSPYPHRPARRSAALILTLLIISLLAIMVVAFVRNMALARSAAHSYGDIERATMAADAGLDIAAAQIVTAVGTNAAFVTGMTGYPTAAYPVTVIGRSDLTNAAQMMPLISGDAAQWTNFGQAGWTADSFAAYAAARTNSGSAAAIDLNTAQQFIQQTNDPNLYRAPWVVITNTVGTQTVYSRFAYLVLDDQARLNPILHNGAGTGMANPTNWYSGPQDLVLTNASAPRLTQAQAGTVAATPQAFAWSGATLGMTFPSRTNYEAVKHLFTAQTNATYDMIPTWLPEGGKPKYNINDLATNGAQTTAGATLRAVNIASIIGNNLTNFYARDPAMATVGKTNYLNRLAANIEDYIDTDQAFTQVNGEPSGHETSVYPVLMAQRMSSSMPSGSTQKAATVSTQFFVSVWNTSSKPFNIQNAEWIFSGRPNFAFGNGSKNPLDYDQSLDPAVRQPTTVNPNEFVVLTFATENVVVNDLPGQTTNVGPSEPGNVDGDYSQFTLKVNGQIVAKIGGANDGGQAPRGGLLDDGSGGNLTDNVSNWTITSTTHFGNIVADPRMNTFYDTVWNSAHGTHYESAQYKGYASGPNSASTGYQDFHVLWAARDYLPREPTVGVAPGATLLPYEVASNYKAADGSAAPEFIRDGPMVSIGELGHVFDPAQVGDDLTTNNVTKSDDNQDFASPFQGGGARSLRVGQAESVGTGPATWDTPGKRAVELLDLFTVNATNSLSAGAGAAVGRVNPNTAPAEVVAALLSGLQLTSDPGMVGGNRVLATAGATPAAAAMAALVVSNRPYASLSDLYKIVPILSSNTFYNPAVSLTAGNGWDASDSVREEAFGRIVQHFCVQSRTYRVYVAGQTLDSRMQPRSSVILEAILYLKPNAATGKFDPVIQSVHALK